MSAIYVGALVCAGLLLVGLLAGAWRLHTLLRLAVHETNRYRRGYNALFEAGFDGLLVLEDGAIVDANGAVERLFGYSAAELRQMAPEQLVPEPYRQQARERIRGHSQAGMEAQGLRRDGSTFPLEATARDHVQDGRALRIVVLRDTSGRLPPQAAAELRAGDERLRGIISAATEAIIVGDGMGTIRFWNRAAEATFGFTAEEVVGRHVTTIMPDRYRAAGMAGIARVSAAANPAEPSRTVEFSAMRKDGSEFPCEVTMAAGYAGGELYLTGSVRDITERVRAREALQRSEERYRQLFDSSNDAIFINGLEENGRPGPITEVNDAACERMGYTREELLRLRANDIRAPETMSDFPDVVQRLLRDKHVLWETVHVAKNGTRIPVEINAKLIELGGKPQVLLAARDISERKRLEQRLVNAQKMETVGRLAGGIAHDFNNLLTAISGHASFALEDLPTGARSREDVSEILTASERAASLTQELLAFSRRQVMRPREVNLNDLVAAMEGVLRGLVGDDIALTVEPADGLGSVRADPGQIQQVLANLVLNAREAMPTGGRVTIETANATLDEAYTNLHPGAAAGQYVMLAVSDTGSGMTPEVREHLFEPFFTTKGLGKGSGLGLATVYGIVKQHQGNIWVYSEPGQGTSLKVYLPRLAVEGRPLQRIEATVLPTGDETVLVAEDEAVVRGVVTRVLRQLGYKVIEAADGAGALALVGEHDDLRLLLTDVVMPQLGGKDLAERLREARPGVRVLFMSGYTDAALAERDRFGRDADFLAKPFSARGLADKVRALLDRA